MSVIEEVAAERKRQIDVEGWSADHDAEHDGGVLAKAAISYAAHACAGLEIPQHDPVKYRAISQPRSWPWDTKWWKPKTPRRDLIRSAALIVAEIERLDRSQKPL